MSPPGVQQRTCAVCKIAASLERYKKLRSAAHETVAVTPQGLANAQRSAQRDHGHVLDPKSAGGARRRAPELERLALVQTRSRIVVRSALCTLLSNPSATPHLLFMIRSAATGAALY